MEKVGKQKGMAYSSTASACSAGSCRAAGDPSIPSLLGGQAESRMASTRLREAAAARDFLAKPGEIGVSHRGRKRCEPLSTSH